MTGESQGQTLSKQLSVHSRQELEQVRQLLLESEELLNQALRLSLSSSHLEGILTRQGAHVHCNAILKQRKDTRVQFQCALPQMSIVLDSLYRTNRLFAMLKEADIETLYAASKSAIRLLGVAKSALKSPDPQTVFPEVVSPIQPGLGGEVYISQSELVCSIYTYQDSKDGHQALSKHNLMAGDPGLLAFTAKLEAGFHRVEHVAHKLSQFLSV